MESGSNHEHIKWITIYRDFADFKNVMFVECILALIGAAIYSVIHPEQNSAPIASAVGATWSGWAPQLQQELIQPEPLSGACREQGSHEDMEEQPQHGDCMKVLHCMKIKGQCSADPRAVYHPSSLEGYVKDDELFVFCCQDVWPFTSGLLAEMPPCTGVW